MECAGPWDPKTGESTGPNYCMPHKIGECDPNCLGYIGAGKLRFW